MPERVDLLPDWAIAELRRPVDSAAGLRERIMESVRASARPRTAVLTRRSHSAPRRGRRLAMSSAIAAIAASMAWMALTPSILGSRARLIPVLGGSTAGSAVVIGDTVDAALRDTLRLVRFVLRAPDAARVALAGDFNDWSATATPLMDSAGSGVWEAVVAIDRVAGRYAFVVDDTQWVRAAYIEPATAEARPRRAAPVGGDST